MRNLMQAMQDGIRQAGNLPSLVMVLVEQMLPNGLAYNRA